MMKRLLKEESKYRTVMLVPGILLAALVWLFETLLHLYQFEGMTLREAFLPESWHELWTRNFVVAAILGFSFYADTIVERLFESRKNIFRIKNEWISTIDSISDPLFIHDSEFRVVRCNKAYQRFAGLPFGKIIGKPYYEVFPRMDGPFSACGKGEKGEGEEFSYDGRMFFIRFHPLKDLNGRLKYSIHNMEDITERKRMEKERSAIRAQLNQAEKMEAISALAGGISDDFSNILTSIRSSAELSLEAVPKASPLYANLRQIISSVDESSRLTRQLYLLSRGRPLKTAPVDMNEIILGQVQIMRDIAGENISINTKLEPGLWFFKGDRGEIGQLLINFSMNARDLMINGGDLEIRTENVTVGEKESAGSNDAYPGRKVCLTITETGDGMQNEAVEKMLEPFIMEHGEAMDPVISLAVAHSMIKRHHGWMTLKNEPRRSTVFRVFFPAE